MISLCEPLHVGYIDRLSDLRGPPCGVHRACFSLARPSMWGTWSRFLPCTVLHVGYMEQVSALHGAPCGVHGAGFSLARCSMWGTWSGFRRRLLPEWRQAEGASLYGSTLGSYSRSAFNRKRLRMARVASAGVSGIFTRILLHHDLLAVFDNNAFVVICYSLTADVVTWSCRICDS